MEAHSNWSPDTFRIADRSTANRLVELLSTGDDVDTISIDDPVAGPTLAVVDYDHLTEAQRETLEVAHETGHFDGDRDERVDFERLAADLGVSEATASERFQSATAALVTAAFGTGGSSDTGRDGTGRESAR